MRALGHDLVRNRILSTLTRTEYQRLRAGFEHVELHAGEILYEPGNDIRYIYFPGNAVVSLLFNVDTRRTVEVAMEGNEGAVGFAIYLGGVTSSNLSIVRDPGVAVRMDVTALIRRANHGARLQGLLNRYVHALVTQIAQLGVCSRFHSIDARLARWLLMTQDRVGSAKFYATQESIAHMLGVRRSGVTTAASSFHKQNIIDYRRGQVEILDKRGLRKASCPCYRVIKHQYDSFLN